MSRLPWSRVSLAVGLFLFVVAIACTRLWRLDTHSLWEDDYLNLDRAMMPLSDMIAVQKYQGPADTIFDFQPPLAYALQHLALSVNESSLAARLPSVIAAMLTPFGMWLLGRRLFGAATGIVAGLLATFLLYPLGFAQAIKAYSVLLCLAVFSLWLVARVEEKDDPGSWIAYGFCALGLLYAGYQGLPAVAAQGLFLGVSRLRRIARGRAGWRSLAWPGLVFAFLGVAFLPWLPAVIFLDEFLRDPSVHPWAGIDAAFGLKILRGFISYNPDLAAGFLWDWGGTMTAGICAGVWRRQWRGLLLLGLTAIATSLALLGSQSLLRPNLEARHFVMAFPPLALLAARGAAGLGELSGWLLRNSRMSRTAEVAVAGLTCLVLLWPSLVRYKEFYDHSLSQDRAFFHWLDRRRGDVDALEFHGYKRNTRRFASNWYLPGRFGEAGTFDGPGYRRIADIDGFYSQEASSRPRFPGVSLADFPCSSVWTRVSLGSAASRAPIVMDPDTAGQWQYVDNFRDRRFYEDALRARNTTLDTELGMLRPARYSQPAAATWEFEVPPGFALSRFELVVAAALYKKHPTLAADSVLVVAAGPDGEHYTNLDVIGQTAFPEKNGVAEESNCPFFDEMGFYHGKCRKTAVSYSVPPELAAGGRLFLRLSYLPGHKEGFLNLSGLSVTAKVRRIGDTGPLETPLELQTRHLLHNIKARRWHEDDKRVGLFAFAAPGHESLVQPWLPLGTPAASAAFLSRHPGLSPVTTLLDREGRPAVHVYDTALAKPGAALSASSPEATLCGLERFVGTPASLRLDGNIAIPTLRLGESTLSIPVIAPAGSTLTLTPGGRGKIVFVPNWAWPARFFAPMSYINGVVASKSVPGELTCSDNGACAFAYTFVTALPITELRLRAFPRIYANPCRKCGPNEAKIIVSTDGGTTYQPLAVSTGGEECTWTPYGEHVFRRLRFDKPVRTLVLGFEMSHGGEAGFLAPPEDMKEMFIEMDVDASILPPLRISGDDLNVSLVEPGQNEFTLTLRPEAWPHSDRIIEP